MPGGRQVAGAIAELGGQRGRIDAARATAATAAAGGLVSDLVQVALAEPDTDVDDELCARLGALLYASAQAPEGESVGPNLLAEAVVAAAGQALRSALVASTGRPEQWQAPWRVLNAVAGILPYPESEIAADTIAELRAAPGGSALPPTPAGPVVTGPVLWTRDAYGSRFGVAAAVDEPGRPRRWYLWDIDACGHQAFTVHSGFYATQEQALAAWRSGAGEAAAAGAEFTPVDNLWLLAELMPVEQGILRAGGENAEQFAEYHRSKRLGQVATQAHEPREARPRAALDLADVAAEFNTWLRTHEVDEPWPEEREELVAQLAESWSISHIDATYHTCSPHRVALTVLHIRDYYPGDVAARVLALLPTWTGWLAERNHTPAHLAERCLPYLHGERHVDLGDNDLRPNYLARVAE